MPCPGFDLELYDLFTLGVLDRDEAAPINEHLRFSCTTCEHYVHQSLERLTSYAMTVPSVVPPRRLRRRVVSSVEPAADESWNWLRSPAVGWATAASLLFVLAVGTWSARSLDSRAFRPVTITRLAPPPPPTVILPGEPTAPSRLPVSHSESASSRAASREVDRAQGSVALTQGLAQQRSHIAELESELRTKDTQLVLAQNENKAIEARSLAASQTGAPLSN